MRPVAVAQRVAVKPTGCGFDPPLEEMNFLLKFILPFLRSGVEAKTRRCVLPLNTQCLQNSVECGERSVFPSVYPAMCGIQREADLF